MDADLPMSSWNPDLLAAAGAFEDFVAAAFAKAETDLFPIFIYMEGKVQKNLVFPGAAADIPGKGAEAYEEYT